jgi:hypothetical protein
MNGVGRVALLIAMVGAMACGQPTLALPSKDQVARIERMVVMPNGAKPLAHYARYYTLETVEGRPSVVGYYLFGEGPPGIHFGESPVVVSDGGCDVVTVVFDLRRNAVQNAHCNGVA